MGEVNECLLGGVARMLLLFGRNNDGSVGTRATSSGISSSTVIRLLRIMHVPSAT